MCWFRRTWYVDLFSMSMTKRQDVCMSLYTFMLFFFFFLFVSAIDRTSCHTPCQHRPPVFSTPGHWVWQPSSVSLFLRRQGVRFVCHLCVSPPFLLLLLLFYFTFFLGCTNCRSFAFVSPFFFFFRFLFSTVYPPEHFFNLLSSHRLAFFFFLAHERSSPCF